MRRVSKRGVWPTMVLLVSAGVVPAGAGWQDSLKGAVEGAKEALSSVQPGTSATALQADEIAAGLKEALRVGAEKATGKASAIDGFLKNPAIRIPLPERLQTAGTLLRRVGLGGRVDAFEETLNRAAEKASAKALPIFGEAVSSLTFQDVERIWKGGETAATDHLRRTTHKRLFQEFRPVVHEAAQSVGVTRSYEALTSRPEIGALVAGGDFDLDHYVTTKALDGVFRLLADEEQQIRSNPLARTTNLLKRVFAQ